jgi:hypothetical protein
MWSWFASNIGTIIAFIGGFGIIGVLVAIFAFGVPFMIIVSSALNFGGKFLEFLKSPLGMALGIMVLCGFFYFMGDVHRTRVDAEYWAEQKRLAEVARKERDAQVQAQVAADANQRIEAILEDQKQLQKQVDNYVSLLKNNPSCLVTDDDIKRLRGR